MSQEHDNSERRRFGRREHCVHGIAYIPGRPPAHCIVRNLSGDGAFIEFNEPLIPVLNFRLVVESKNLDVICEVRHKRSRGVGVFFEKTVKEVLAKPRRVSDPELRYAIGPMMTKQRWGPDREVREELPEGTQFWLGGVGMNCAPRLFTGTGQRPVNARTITPRS